MKPNEHFFFSSQRAKEALRLQTEKAIPLLRERVKLLTIVEFCNLCESSILQDSCQTYLDFIHCWEVIDLTDLPPSKLAAKEAYLCSYRKTITEMLMTKHTEQVIVWFYFNKG